MHDGMASSPAATTPRPADLPDRLAQRLTVLLGIVADFHGRGPTPAATFALEKKWPKSFT